MRAATGSENRAPAGLRRGAECSDRHRTSTLVGAVVLLAGLTTPLVLGASPAGANITPIAACPAPVITGTTAVVTCSYNGTTGADGTDQTWTVPTGVTQATFDVYGAQGGGAFGANGGEATGLFAVTSGTSFTIVVGGEGGTPFGCTGAGAGAGGFGGGGTGGTAVPSQGFHCDGGAGGGASAVDNASTPVVVAGGGGGGANCEGAPYSANGGGGGGLSGTAGVQCGSSSVAGGGPGTQGSGGVGTGGDTNGTPGQGGTGTACTGYVCAAGGGGGGGYYGGGGGQPFAGGGGGSGYVALSAITSNMNTGFQSGNGVVTITYTLPATSSTTTASITGTGSTVIGAGGTLTDTLTVTGTSGTTPTNTPGGVAFYVCQVSTSSTLTPGVCPATGTPFDAAENLNGSAQATSGPFTPTGVGTWCFSATYGGDSHNAPSADNTTVTDTNECVLISPASPSITTTPSATSITLGPTPPILKDTAMVSGGDNPTGTITFTLYDGANPTPVYHSEPVSVTGNGPYTPHSGYTLPTTGTVTGTYQWDASYSGDPNNNAASENNATGEQVKVVSPCGPLTAYFLAATSGAGSFNGLFCVNASGSGTYSQNGGTTVTGKVLTSGATTWISASGTGLALLGEKTTASSTFTETAPAPMKSGTFTLATLP
jgi:hypothetical protein